MSQHNPDVNQIASGIGLLSGLAGREAEVMERALASAPTLRKLFTNVAGTIHWYLLDCPPSLRGKNFGTAGSEQEAESMIIKLLESTTNRRVAV